MMKQIITLLLLSLSLAAFSAPQGAGKSVFTLTTYKADGTILATTHGVYAGAPGEGISPFTPFIGAASAVIIDASGKRANVEAIYGANEIYDLCRFRLSSTNGTPLAFATQAATTTATAVGYSTKKAPTTTLTVKNAETFLDNYTYYIYNEEITEELEGCPIVNEAGQLLGLVQRSSANYDIHSTDARFCSTLTSNGLSYRDATLRKTAIPVALPQDHDQARLMLLMINSEADSLAALQGINEYISTYPTDVDGYSALARFHVGHENLAQASEAMLLATKKVANADEAYSDYANIVYNAVIMLPDSTECEWNLDLAEENIRKAIDINPKASYQHQLAQIAYGKHDYAQAYSLFEQVSQSEIATSEVFYEMAQSQSQLGADAEVVLGHLTQAVDHCPQPLTYTSAPYILARGTQLDAMGKYRKALLDYNLYDSLMAYRAPADFYYTRYRCEVNARLYQQALNDIAHAAILNPQELTYLAELASLQLRVNQFDNAAKTCDLGLQVTDEYADLYIIKGVALSQLGRKDEAREALLRAKELGDERAEDYIEKYTK